jgi:hypothetical protein
MRLSVIHRAFEESSRLVAFVDVSDDMPVEEALEYAYFRTQNLKGSWSREAEFEFGGEIHQNGDFSEDVTVMADLPVSKRTGQVMGLRSTSVGDRIIYGNTCYRVDDFGFEKEAA